MQPQPIAKSKHERQLDAFLELSNAVNNSDSLIAVLNTTCRKAVELTGVDHSAMVLFDPARQMGVVKAEYGPGFPSTMRTEVPLKEPMAVELLLNLEPIPIKNIHDPDQKRLLGGIFEILDGFGITSILIVPVVSGDHAVGSFSLDSRQERDISSDDIAICKLLAAQIAAAVENHRRNERSDDLRRAVLAISGIQNRANLLKVIVEQAVRILDGKSGGLYKFFPEQSTLRIVADHQREHLVGTELKLGEGIAGKLVADPLTRSRFEPNYSKCPDRALVFGESLFEAVIETKIGPPTEPFGVLYVDDVLGRVFTRDDIRSLELFIEHAAIALENVAWSDAAAGWELIDRAVKILVEARDFQQGFQTLGDFFVRELQAAFCRFLLLAERELQPELLCVRTSGSLALKGWEKELTRPSEHAELAGLHHLLQRKDAVLRLDQPEAYRAYPRLIADKLGFQQHLSFLLLSALGDSPPIIVMELGWREPHGADRSESLEKLCREITLKLGPLVGRLWLQEKEQRELSGLKRLAQVVPELRPHMGLARLREDAARLATQFAQADAAALYLHWPEQRILEMVAKFGPVGASLGSRSSVYDGIAGQAARENQLCVGRANTAEPHLNAASLGELVALPLRCHGYPKYVLGLGLNIRFVGGICG